MFPRQKKSKPWIDSDHRLQTLQKKVEKKIGAPGVNAERQDQES